jgi:hypothetical protein
MLCLRGGGLGETFRNLGRFLGIWVGSVAPGSSVNFLAGRRRVLRGWFSLRMALPEERKEPFNGEKVGFPRKVCLPGGVERGFRRGEGCFPGKGGLP